jgi:hypothetical protein
MPLDQVVLEEERLHLGRGNDPLERPCPVDHLGYLGRHPVYARFARGRQVTRQPPTQGQGFAHIQHRAALFPEQIHPGEIGSLPHLSFQLC